MQFYFHLQFKLAASMTVHWTTHTRRREVATIVSKLKDFKLYSLRIPLKVALCYSVLPWSYSNLNIYLLINLIIYRYMYDY